MIIGTLPLLYPGCPSHNPDKNIETEILILGEFQSDLYFNKERVTRGLKVISLKLILKLAYTTVGREYNEVNLYNDKAAQTMSIKMLST